MEQLREVTEWQHKAKNAMETNENEPRSNGKARSRTDRLWKRMDTSGKGKAGCDEATQRNRADRNRADGQCKGTAERRGDRKSNAMEEIRRGARGTAKEKHAREERRKAKELL